MIALRVLSACGWLLSGYLLLQKLTGKISYLVGCGAGSGCENVLGSKWSQWFYVPVTALSLGLYAALLFLSFKPRRTPLLAIATCLAGAALWFGVVQAFILKSFCPWCLTAHLIGAACAVVIFMKSGAEANLPAATGPAAPLAPGLMAGLAATAILIAGQVFGPQPDTHQETNFVYTPDEPAAPPAPVVPAPHSDGRTTPGPTPVPAVAATGPVHSRGEGRKVTFLVNKEYNLTALPHIGDPNAPHVLVKYFDYACSSCRDMHDDLDAVMAKHPGKFCIILLPCPINRACNPHLASHVPDHEHSCELARVALACWRTDPETFPAVHNALFARPVMDQAKALEAVKPLMKKPLTPEALADPWIAEVLAADAEDYKKVNVTNAGTMNYLMPKLLVGGTQMLHGILKSREQLIKALELQFKLSSP